MADIPGNGPKAAAPAILAILILSLALLAAAVAPPWALASQDLPAVLASGADAAATGSAGQAPPSAAEAAVPTRYGMSLEYGNTYDPGTDIGFVLLSGFALYDYGAFWHQKRPRELRFKIEGAVGSSVRPDGGAVASIGMLALYYLDFIAGRDVRPYFEAGIGAIYTDFRVAGQGLRFNFNPQLGIGADLRQESGAALFAAIRLHHISNGEFYRENRGVNSLILQVGRHF